MLFFVISGTLYFSALTQAKPFFPAALHDDLTMRFAMDSFIWERSVPVRLRRNYLLSLVFGGLGIASIAIGAYLEKSLMLAMVFGCMSLGTFLAILIKWRRYRDRL